MHATFRVIGALTPTADVFVASASQNMKEALLRSSSPGNNVPVFSNPQLISFTVAGILGSMPFVALEGSGREEGSSSSSDSETSFGKTDAQQIERSPWVVRGVRPD